MKERRRKSKKQQQPPAETPDRPAKLDRFRTYAEGPQGRLALPALVALLTLLIGVWFWPVNRTSWPVCST